MHSASALPYIIYAPLFQPFSRARLNNPMAIKHGVLLPEPCHESYDHTCTTFSGTLCWICFFCQSQLRLSGSPAQTQQRLQRVLLLHFAGCNLRGMVYLRQEVWCTSGPPCGGKCCEGYYLRRTPSMSSSAGCSVFTVLGHRKQPRCIYVPSTDQS